MKNCNRCSTAFEAADTCYVLRAEQKDRATGSLAVKIWWRCISKSHFINISSYSCILRAGDAVYCSLTSY